VTPVRGLIRNSLPSLLWTASSHLPCLAASIPLRLKPGLYDSSPVSGSVSDATPEAAAGSDRDLVELLVVRVGEERAAARDDDVVDEARARGRELVLLDQRAVVGVVDEPLARRGAGDEQAIVPSVVFDAGRSTATACDTGDEDVGVLRVPDVAAVDSPRRNRADEERLAIDRDALGLEPGRQRDRLRKVSPLVRARRQRSQWATATNAADSNVSRRIEQPPRSRFSRKTTAIGRGRFVTDVT
jgi:hypothetical protein